MTENSPNSLLINFDLSNSGIRPYICRKVSMVCHSSRFHSKSYCRYRTLRDTDREPVIRTAKLPVQIVLSKPILGKLTEN